MSECAVEMPATREAPKARDASGGGARFAGEARSAVMPDNRVRMPPVLEQLERVRQRTRRQRDVVPAALQQFHQWP
jgi:hypothetical protein